MNSKRTAALLAAVIGLIQTATTGSAQTQTVTQEASKDSFFTAMYPMDSFGYNNNLYIGGPSGSLNLLSAIAYAQVAPAGATVTNFDIVFDIQEDLPMGLTTSLNILQLGGPWDENSTYNDIAGYTLTPEGAVTLTVGLLPNLDNSITFSGPTLTALYADGQLANGIFWHDNDLATVFPGGATAYSKDTQFDGMSLGGVGYVTYQVPEPSTWTMLVGGIALIVFLLRRSWFSGHA